MDPHHILSLLRTDDRIYYITAQWEPNVEYMVPTLRCPYVSPDSLKEVFNIDEFKEEPFQKIFQEAYEEARCFRNTKYAVFRRKLLDTFCVNEYYARVVVFELSRAWYFEDSEVLKGALEPLFERRFKELSPPPKENTPEEH